MARFFLFSSLVFSALCAQAQLDSLVEHYFEQSMRFVRVGEGVFTMGCTSEQYDCGKNEKWPRRVFLDSYYIGRHEVTQAQWVQVMGENPSAFSDCSNCPVEKVSWEAVQVFIQKLNEQTGQQYRLPTEAEWEYAARGGPLEEPSVYAGGGDLKAIAWHAPSAGGHPHPVGQKQPNELGLYDMTGNVCEWCSDWYGKYYYKRPIRNPNPQGPSRGKFRVVRGGAYDCYGRYNRLSYRAYNFPFGSSTTVGFRLVREPSTAKKDSE